MNTYSAIIKYKGTNYFGWQIQTGTVQKTIQSELHRALNKLCAGRKDSYSSIASGRTDAGVHSVGQVIKIEIDFSIEPQSLMRAINSLLPSSIKLLEIMNCEESFHPIFHAKSKVYRYYFSTNKENPFDAELLTYIKKDLDIDLMKKACKLIIGEHDFMNYFCTGTPVKTTIRKIYNCQVFKCAEGDFIREGHYLEIEGNGFLKQMVRLIMGALLNIGQGKITLLQFSNSLNSLSKNKLGAVAPSQGLYLYKVNY